MRKSILSLFSYALIVVLISSCNTSSDLTSTSVIKKRRYLKGYQVNVKGSQKSEPKTETVAAQIEPIEIKKSDFEPNMELAQASVSTEITEADLKKSTFVASVKSQKAATANEKSISLTKSDRNSRNKGREGISQKKLKTDVVSGVPQSASGANMVLYIILAILLPPLAVGLLYGIGTEFLISLILTILFWVPGVIYALIMVLRKG